MDIDFQDLVTHIFDGLYLVDSQRKIVYWNKNAEKITGYRAGEVIGSHCWNNILMHVDQRGQSLCKHMCPLAATIQDGTARETEIYLHHKEGHRVPVWVRTTPLRDKAGAIIGGAELFTDLSAQNTITSKIRELEKLSYIDQLTQLANRRYCEMALENLLAEKARTGLSFAVMLIDIDHFKAFNDTYGHGVGDLVLQSVAKTLLHTSRPYDVFGRWGGEEFIGIIRDIDQEALASRCERTRHLIAHSSVKAGDRRLRVTVSIGAAIAKTDDNVQTVIKRGDDRLYLSKDAGRNQCTISNEG
jgi:diguanylate cyclase (GGDEF)-like protein/PAS domain S-box-containing protein